MKVEDVSLRLGAWINEYFDVDEESTELRCRRCQMPVGYPTKHAAVRHGDPIRILPVTPNKLGRISAANAF